MREIPLAMPGASMESLSEAAGESGDEEAHLELWDLLTSATALLLMCFYVVYMSVHLLALSYAWVSAAPGIIRMSVAST